MNTILLQKILDILTEGLAHVGDFFKDLFVTDPQDGQVIGYDADAGKWKNMSIAELALDVTDTAGPDDIITFSDAADMPLKSLIANINVEGGTSEVNITHTGKNLFDPIVYNNYLQPDGKYQGQASDITAIKSYLGAYIGKKLTFSAYVDLTVTPSPTNVRVVANINGVSINGNIYSGNEGYTSVTFTPQSANDYIFLTFSSGGGYSFTFYNIQLEEGSTRTTYEAYTGTTETINLPSSVTSGYVDIITGQGMSGDTPFTVTPTIINSTSGVNNIFADTGDVTAVYYTKAAGDIKSLVCITEDITSEVTKNTTDFSDILLKVSRNNKVVSVEIYSATTAAAVNDTFLSNLPKPAMNSKVLLANTTLGEDGTILGTLKTSGELEITTPGAKSFSGLITYVAK